MTSKEVPYWTTLPRGFELVEEDNKLYIKQDGVWIVSGVSPARKHFRGTDDKARERASRWIYRYANGFCSEYRKAWSHQEVV